MAVVVVGGTVLDIQVRLIWYACFVIDPLGRSRDARAVVGDAGSPYSS
jgi:hypothetical protein